MSVAVSPIRAPLARGAQAIRVPAVLIAGLLAGTGWLYLLRGLGWLGFGPRVGGALPLLQLAGFDGQPLARVTVAWLLAGALAGGLLHRLGPGVRFALAGGLALLVLLVAAQAAFALARNLRFAGVLWSHAPGAGPVLEALAFAVGCSLPGALRLGAGSGRRGRRRR